MKKFFLSCCLLLLCSVSLLAQQTPASHNQKMEWWREARFGMFVHWGPYALWGGEYHGHQQRVGGAEWIMNRCKISVAEYQEMTRKFNPVDYDPEAWVRLAKETGMKYIVFTTKHHDGFAMFKSSASKYNMVDFTPYGKDVVDALVKACRKEGMKFVFYYSQSQDWNNPGGATHRRPMNQGWPNPDSLAIDAYTLAHNGSWDPAQQTRTIEQYMDSVAIPQVRELLSRYDDVAVFFWDTPKGITNAYAKKFIDLFKDHPNVIHNDRMGGGFLGDYKTPEQMIPTVAQLDSTDWETCMTLNNSWGYRRSGNIWKPAKQLITTLIDIASKGGNLLLNVGPDPQGNIPQENIDRMKVIGQWMKKYGASIYGTERCKTDKPTWGYCTQKITNGKTHVYLQVIDWPKNGELLFALHEPASAARLLHNGKELKLGNTAEGIRIAVPEKAPDEIASVIELEFDKVLPRYPIKTMNDNLYEIVDAPRK